MTDEEFVAASNKTYMIPVKYLNNAPAYFINNREFVPACIVTYITTDRNVVRMYCFGAHIANQRLQTDFCISANVPINELKQYETSGNNKLESFIQRRKNETY